MALTIGQKHGRFIQFLRGLHHPRVATLLTRHGLRQEDYDQAFLLLRGAVGRKLNIPRYVAPDPSVFERLDTWENRWFPIIKASLRHQFPEVHDTVFLNLAQTDGPDVMVSVDTLVRRLRELQAEDSETARAAMELLERRGVTEEVLAEAERELGQIVTKPELIDEPASPEDRAAAEAAMWDWYLEWSTIARQVIRDRNLLRMLGFLQNRTSSDEDTETSAGSEEPQSPQQVVQQDKVA